VGALEEKYIEKADPLKYKAVKYHKREWDNIPPIVPKFCINMSKHIEGLSKIANRQSTEETVLQLRTFTEESLSVS
jgi:hypothetical protein